MRRSPAIPQLRPRLLEQRRHTMVVGRGLYLLRYVSAGSPESPPSVEINQDPYNPNIALMCAPGGADTHLDSPGECMVVRAETPGALSLVVSANNPDGSIDAELRLERIVLDRAGESPRNAPVREVANPRDAAPGELSVMAHVSRRGDVVVEAGEWICGPDMPLPIEGISIDWPERPAGVEIEYSVSIGRASQKHSLSAVTGQFAGTRGRAAALMEVIVALSGPMAANFELEARALFLGAAIDLQRGKRLHFRGPSGREPLVGFQIQIKAAQKPLGWEDEGGKMPRKKRPAKVRVYRPASTVTEQAVSDLNTIIR